MDPITLRVIDGPDTGTVFSDMSFPISIGREKENTIELKDERVSRFHLKIVYESDMPLLVDLGSTNGTQVNGEVVQFWFLRPGDLISLGRTSFLFGSRQEIAERLKDIRNRLKQGEKSFPSVTVTDFLAKDPKDDLSWEKTYYSALKDELFSKSESELLRSAFPPKIPAHLAPGQIAQMTIFFTYFVARFRDLLENIRSFDVSVDASFKGLEDLDGDKQGHMAKKKSFLQKAFLSRSEKQQNSDKISALKEIIPDGGVFLPLREYENLLDMISLFSDYLASLTRDVAIPSLECKESVEDDTSDKIE